MTLFPAPPPTPLPTHTYSGGPRVPSFSTGFSLGTLVHHLCVATFPHTLSQERKAQPLRLLPRSNSTLYGLELDSVQGTEGP